MSPQTAAAGEDGDSEKFDIGITQVFYGEEATVKSLDIFYSTKYNFDACGDAISPSVCMGFEPLKKAYLDLKRRGVKIRFIAEINQVNLHFCKELLNIVTEMRHLDGAMGNFGICDGKDYLAAANIKEKQAIPYLIYSNVKEVVDQQQHIFESFWNRASPAEQKIAELEEGKILGTTEVLQDQQITKEVFVDMVKSAKEEVLLLCPTTNAFLREQRIGIIDQLVHTASSSETGPRVRIIVPASKVLDANIDHLTATNCSNFNIQRIDYSEFTESAVTTITILVVDRKSSLVIEKLDDSKENFIEAIGLATLSTSKPTVMSYVSIFESLWNQVKIYKQLKINDKMRKDFINVAAHELRTPIVPILGLSEILHSRITKDGALSSSSEAVKSSTKRYLEMLCTVIRNANRLSRLTEDILDVTKIESQTLRLKKERFDIEDIIMNTILEFKEETKNVDPGNRRREILYEPLSSKFKDVLVLVDADKSRISQVLSNLISNSIKFTDDTGIINIKIDFLSNQEPSGFNNTKESDEEINKERERGSIVITVEDNGSGIDPEVFSKLFIKFVSKSFHGTGLGLFISKSIVEAHGGKIWAKNNINGPGGAMFSFTIPIARIEKNSHTSHQLQEFQLEDQRKTTIK
jgi:signal transduction histidine kinase